jgi:hypothetical protein
MDAVRAAIAEPFDADGNPKYCETFPGDTLSIDAAKKNIDEIVHATLGATQSAYHVTQVKINHDNPNLTCDETGDKIIRRRS